jgi:hypothetical protein
MTLQFCVIADSLISVYVRRPSYVRPGLASDPLSPDRGQIRSLRSTNCSLTTRTEAGASFAPVPSAFRALPCSVKQARAAA